MRLIIYKMKINRILTIIFPLIIFTTFSSILFAQSVKINAGILPSVWFSSLNVQDKENIKIYGGIQNHSSLSFSGVASILVDNAEKSKVDFVSDAGSLIEIGDVWNSTGGTHSAQIKIISAKAMSNSSPGFSTSSLLLAESDKVSFSVEKIITADDVKNTAKDIALSVVNGIDNVANTLADKVELLKKPDQNVSVTKATSKNQSASIKTADKGTTYTGGKVLGAETKYQATSNTGIFKYPFVTSAYNMLIDFLSMIIRNWQITLFVIIILYILIRYFVL